MLARLLGSINKERVLVFLVARNRGYAREAARLFQAPLSPMQKAFEGLEFAGVVVSRAVGSTVEYEMNPRYPARRELDQLVRRAIELYPRDLREKLTVVRTRPRRRGKPQ